MFRISLLAEKLEKRTGMFLERYRGKLKLYAALALCGWYFYGMIINSIRLGIDSVFNDTGKTVASIWTVNPFKNLSAVFTVTGLAVTAVSFLLFCLITKKGYILFSGYKYKKDARGFDILPNGTHGTSGFMSEKEMGTILNLKNLSDTDGTVIGKIRGFPNDNDDKYSKYVSVKRDSGLSDHTVILGSTGSGKSRGYVRPFIFQAAKRRESVILVDPKGELYESTSEFMRREGYTVKVFNLLDPENSDGWNCLNDIELNRSLVDSIAEVIIKNTSNISERQDFWEKAEKNLLQALMHYVQSQKEYGTGRLLPIEERSLGAIYRLLSDESFMELDTRFSELPKNHPARAPYGIFKLANRQIWGNIAIGLGNRLAVFQNPLIDQITSHNDIDLTLPGRSPCIYYCIISAQDSRYEFLSSLFFSCITARLMDYARREGEKSRLPVTVNLQLEEFCNIGTLGVDFLKQLAILRGFNINCQMLVQSVPQLRNRYPKDEWEEIISHCDTMICLGANDLKTAGYVSEKCGSVTIRTESNQMPLMPLFSPVYNSTRPYSQTTGSTERALMMPDEILRMDAKKSIVLLRGQKPVMLDKVTPEEFSASKFLKPVKITDYIPVWKNVRETPLPETVEKACPRPAGISEPSVYADEPDSPSGKSVEGTQTGMFGSKYGALTPVEVSPKDIIKGGGF